MQLVNDLIGYGILETTAQNALLNPLPISIYIINPQYKYHPRISSPSLNLAFPLS